MPIDFRFIFSLQSTIVTWIDERLEKRNELIRRNTAVASGAEGLFNDLWKEVFSLLTEAKQKGFGIRTNGSSFERFAWVSNYPPSRDERELKLNLSREEEKVSATICNQVIEFSIDMCEDGVVCLKREGKAVLIQEAAKYILDPLLFPELQAKIIT